MSALHNYLFFKIYFVPLFSSFIMGFPGGSDSKESPAMWETWVGKIPWRRKWQPTPVFLPGKSHRLSRLLGYSSRCRKESDTTEWLSHTYIIWAKSMSSFLSHLFFKIYFIPLFSSFQMKKLLISHDRLIPLPAFDSISQRFPVS